MHAKPYENEFTNQIAVVDAQSIANDPNLILVLYVILISLVLYQRINHFRLYCAISIN